MRYLQGIFSSYSSRYYFYSKKIKINAIDNIKENRTVANIQINTLSHKIYNFKRSKLFLKYFIGLYFKKNRTQDFRLETRKFKTFLISYS